MITKISLLPPRILPTKTSIIDKLYDNASQYVLYVQNACTE